MKKNNDEVLAKIKEIEELTIECMKYTHEDLEFAMKIMSKKVKELEKLMNKEK